MFSSPPSTPSCVYTILDILTSTWCSVQWEVVYNTAVESVNSGARLPGCDSSSTTWKSRIKYLMSPCLKFFTSGYARRIKWIDAYKVLRIDLLSVNWRHYSLIIFFFQDTSFQSLSSLVLVGSWDSSPSVLTLSLQGSVQESSVVSELEGLAQYLDCAVISYLLNACTVLNFVLDAWETGERTDKTFALWSSSSSGGDGH